jgi:4-amino-4-deoxy-L-arabinose transferase-like glycosyltransferase
VIYAAVAKSVVQHGEWGTLYLAGQPFFDKPPLVVWLAALSFKLFGISTWSARLPAVALAIGSCFLLWRLGAVLFEERVGLAAAAIFASTSGVVRVGSTLLLDSSLAFGSLAGLLAAAHAFERRGAGLWQAGAWFGVALLGKGALALGAPAVLAAWWLAVPRIERPPLRAILGALGAFLAVVLPWHLWEAWGWGARFVRPYAWDVTQKLGAPLPARVYVEVLLDTTLPWLPVAVFGAWRAWRDDVPRPGIRMLAVWTVVAYAFLFTARKHSPRYLMLLHPALALWAALGLRALLPAPRRLATVVAGAGMLAWIAVLAWPRPMHPTGEREDVVVLARDLGPPGTPIVALRVSESTRARFAFYADRDDVRTYVGSEDVARLGPGTRFVASRRVANRLATDDRFEVVGRSPEFAVLRVRASPSSN